MTEESFAVICTQADLPAVGTPVRFALQGSILSLVWDSGSLGVLKPLDEDGMAISREGGHGVVDRAEEAWIEGPFTTPYSRNFVREIVARKQGSWTLWIRTDGGPATGAITPLPEGTRVLPDGIGPDMENIEDLSPFDD